jgi:hypothetical protein
MGNATITHDEICWVFAYGSHKQYFASREEAVQYAEAYSDDTGESFVLTIQKEA